MECGAMLTCIILLIMDVRMADECLVTMIASTMEVIEDDFIASL
ncbi:hypothetical protein F443_13913 [Phytophthora nicotianae P1569]|uniref:Uncharacterized protein n=1 Tax=Phytophthora nicotianae P1569 TaxID=1317065 RepID=V9EQJ7_PHYNI|nr:hypothetical protein F443_13913 [Phytophthora nicotianae P1569]